LERWGGGGAWRMGCGGRGAGGGARVRIPPRAVGGGGEKTGGALAATAFCTTAVPARPAKSPSESTCRFLYDLCIVSSSYRALIRFSGPPFTTADRDALCKLIG